MGDRGQWSKADYEYEKQKAENLIKRRNISIAKLLVKREELQLQIDEINIQIAEQNSKIDKSQQSIKWMEDQLNVRY